MKVADRLKDVELSLIRQINALATPLSVNLGIGEPNLAPDGHFRELAERAAQVPWQYTPNAGTLSLRKRLCEGTLFDPKTEVCVTAGTQEALFAVFTAYVEPGDEVLVPNPGFLSYATLAKIHGAEVVTYDLDPPDWRIDIQALRKRVTPKTKLIIVNSPSNPLGSVADAPTLDAVAALGPLVVSDEVYREIWYDAPPPTMLGRGANVVTLNGLSKSHGMTGLRLGWMHAQADVMKPIITAHQYIATCASAFSQGLAELIFDDAEWNRTWLAAMRAQFAAQREAALYAIRHELEIELEPPAGAFYAFAAVPACDSISFAKTLATDAAVLVIPGLAFGTRGQGFIRISYAAPVEQITAGIERIGRWLRAAGI
ncbi:MAG: pyridoxal phosphate-dependent aminotransferase [Acidobacteria bacterium]|nr:pyridoxal phosphate-dependent aminotransferase [Acidobacteriota bacterium]MBV9474443.1 pyridoxal phosphate-dependent aminotransferase [Acidobacteriota bacterium]